jgi:hypothetical protein
LRGYLVKVSSNLPYYFNLLCYQLIRRNDQAFIFIDLNRHRNIGHFYNLSSLSINLNGLPKHKSTATEKTTQDTRENIPRCEAVREIAAAAIIDPMIKSKLEVKILVSTPACCKAVKVTNINHN